MDEVKLANWLTVIMVIGHFLLALGTGALGVLGVFRYEDALDLLPLYFPVGGAYASVMWASVVTRRTRRAAKPNPLSVSGVEAGISFFLVGALFFGVAGLVAGMAWNRISLPQCKLGLATLETMLAVFMGPMVKRFFPSQGRRVGASPQGLPPQPQIPPESPAKP